MLCAWLGTKFIRRVPCVLKWTATVLLFIVGVTIFCQKLTYLISGNLTKLFWQKTAYQKYADYFYYDTNDAYNDSRFDDSAQQLGPDLRARIPRALIIGVRKGGTRALLDALSLHPEIRVARREVHYFDQPDNYRRGVDWYLEQMPLSASHHVTIEKTPAYFVNPTVVERVYKLYPEMKLILIVRDPVIRLISDFTQVLHTRAARNKTLPQFEDTVFATGAHRLNLSCKPIRNSLYARHIQRWLRRFSLSQLHVVDGDRFIEDPLNELRAVESFLDVAHAIRDDQLIFNRRKGFYCFRQSERRAARCLGATKGRAQTYVNETTRSMLARLFRAENKKFFHQIGRNFTNWL